MVVTFLYNNKTYTTDNLERKLEKLGITTNDIEIRKKQDCAIGEPDRDKKLYYFVNSKTGYTIVSIYNDLRNLEGII